MDITDPRVEQYALAHTTPEPPLLARVAEETREATSAPGMMVGALEGAFLAALVAVSRAQRVLEVGTFTGYSSLSMAAALAPGGRIDTCEIDERHAEIARRNIAASPYAGRIEVHLGPAAETIGRLDGPYDLVFIDADKTGYLDYYEAVLPKLTDHGVIAVDNVLWSGAVTERDATDESTVALQRFNDHVVTDDRVTCVMLPVRDGVTLIRRRAPG